MTDKTHSPDEIAKLKATARRHYLAHQQAAAEFSCGATLAAFIRPEIGVHASAFNEAMAKLREIDPACPQYEPLPL